jgi:hypothetical protein
MANRRQFVGGLISFGRKNEIMFYRTPALKGLFFYAFMFICPTPISSNNIISSSIVQYAQIKPIKTI